MSVLGWGGRLGLIGGKCSVSSQPCLSENCSVTLSEYTLDLSAPARRHGINDSSTSFQEAEIWGGLFAQVHCEEFSEWW